MRTPSDEWLVATAAQMEPLRWLRTLPGWVGAGRRLTQTGRITLAHARELVGLLGTREAIDPRSAIGCSAREQTPPVLEGLDLIGRWV